MNNGQHAVYPEVPADGHQHGQKHQVEQERMGEESPPFGAGDDEGIQRSVYDIGQDGHEDDEPMVQRPPKSELLRYPDSTCGVAYVCQQKQEHISPDVSCLASTVDSPRRNSTQQARSSSPRFSVQLF